MITIPEQTSQGFERESLQDPSINERWARLVASVQAGSQEAMEELYSTFGRGIRFYLSRQLGPQDLDDKVHDTFLVVINAIQRGELREPDRLMGYVRTVVRRMVATHIDHLVEERREFTDIHEVSIVADGRSDPERDALQIQQIQIMKQVLRQISGRDREILTRFYLYEQTPDQICAEMGLTVTQFRLLKSRAKARFSELGKRRLENVITSENKNLRKTAGC